VVSTWTILEVDVGVLRTILALLVVGSHLHAFGGATFAVKTFFIISGFYMALVIDTRYWKLPVSSFYASRLLRLLPLYWVIGLLTLIAEVALVPRGQYFDKLASPLTYGAGLDLSSLPIPIILYIGVSITTMLGLDTGLWIGFDRVSGALSFAPDFAPGVTSVVALDPAPQAWTVGLELLFYALAPFIVRRSIWLIVSLCAFSLAFRLALMWLGFSGEPWNRALFPSELIYFLLGVLGYRLYLFIPRLNLPDRTQTALGLAVLVLAILYWPVEHSIRGNPVWHVWNTAPYLLIAAGIPFLFKRTKDNTLDANIGELSYPIYMCHVLVLGLITWSPLSHAPFIGSGWPRYIFSIALVIAAAFFLDRLVVPPIDKLRVRFGAKDRIEPDAAFGSSEADLPAGLRPAKATHGPTRAQDNRG
jgi:peptidoglycan/LPS O-acetylase OafA/YrhL